MYVSAMTRATACLSGRLLYWVWTGTRLLLILMVLAVEGCQSINSWTKEMDTKMISRNAYTGSVVGAATTAGEAVGEGRIRVNVETDVKLLSISSGVNP